MCDGWLEDSSGKDLPIHVANFPNSPEVGAITYATIGLSEIPLYLESMDGDAERSFCSALETPRILQALMAFCIASLLKWRKLETRLPEGLS
jgi:hypothetical protein